MKQNSMKKNFLVSFFRTGVMILVPLIIFPYVSRILGKEGVGRVQYIQSIASYFQLLATFGISSYGIREGSKLKNDRAALGRLCTELFLINLIMTLISVAIYTVTFFVEGLQSYHELLFLYLAYIIFYGLNLDWFFNVLEDYVYITIRTCIVYGLSLIIMFLFLRDRQDVNVYAIVSIFPYIGIFFSNFSQMRRKVALFSEKRYNLRQHIKPIALVFGIIISSSIYSLLDTTMLGVMCDDSSVGLYTAASKLCRLVVQLITSICAVFLPRLSYYAGTKEKEKYQELALTSANLIVLIAVPCAMGIFVLASQAITLFSGEEFLGAVPATRILAINLFFSALDSFLGWQILVPNNKDKTLLLATVVGAVTDFILNIIMIPRLGVEGAAIATLVSECAVFTICSTAAMKYLQCRSFLLRFLRCVIAALPVFVIGYAVNHAVSSVIGSSALVVILTAICYFGILWLIRDPFVHAVWGDVAAFIRKRKR